MSEHDDPLADAVNQEPIVYYDCTQTELMTSILIGAVAGLIIGVILGIAIGIIMFGIVIGLIIGLGISWGLLEWLKYIRQKYYLTWFKEKVLLMKINFGLVNTKYIGDSKRFGKGARRG
ncbi:MULTISPECIES: DUF3487 family protein [unclassified Cellvibrio]|uniref:DUF3487 family protein n=1 Tax=unclassified Cellvibrio TaxID=2624793 RepID=UPI0012455BBD|nr:MULTISPECIES: DUF3487 family protein [unclassified Cellvibrio]QEY16064.1 DUF3487 family protein [Cellvibrio sp. KY-GH-1]UUA74292.1 TIGR03750 family conjugal transfer protein [Cellvibrio sp. QJXJ]